MVANHYGQSAGQVAEKQDEKEEARLKGNVRQGNSKKKLSSVIGGISTLPSKNSFIFTKNV